MRRARIKCVATVPVRRKIRKDIEASEDTNVVSIDEHVEANISNTDVFEQETTARDTAKIQEETIQKGHEEVNITEPNVVIAKNSDSQDSCTKVNDKPKGGNEQSGQKNIPLSETPTITDPVSPTKITQNRPCFMRPTPRLDTGGRVRKNSVQGSGASASESEDEHGKRTSAAPSRNDSICSIQSNRESVSSDCQNNSLQIKTAQKRRILVSESARKLAEARREFLLKHENRTPDRSQLKMYDLIYYNPVTNPMKKSKPSTTVPRQIPVPQPIEAPEEEDEDDPSAMPAPQVKVGPDGQLIIDERSLVIEQTSVRKNRDMLAQEAIVDDDNYGGGFYKKRQKSKEWPKWETLKFYRALNVVGTDFLLMQSLFPNRTRQQIKQKYKKEERVNRPLIEKALKYHQEFDTEILEQQLTMLQKLENIQTGATKKSSEKDKNERQTKMAAKRRRRFVATSIAECEMSPVSGQGAEDATVLTTNDSSDVETNGDTSSSQYQQERKENKRKLKKRLDDSSDRSEDSSCASSNANSDSDTEVYRIRPTRSGRLPKVKKLQGPDINTLDNYTKNKSLVNSKTVTSLQKSPERITNNSCAVITKDLLSVDNREVETPCPENITNAIPDINKIEPGSLVILSKESTEEPGNTILQVYMVSSNIDNANATMKSDVKPVDLSPELLSTVTNKIEDIEPVNVVDDCE